MSNEIHLKVDLNIGNKTPFSITKWRIIALSNKSNVSGYLHTLILLFNILFNCNCVPTILNMKTNFMKHFNKIIPLDAIC